MISAETDKQLIVFSDLDGSLLDHNSYSWNEATTALRLLAERGIPLVLVSSKTLAELEDYRLRLGLEHPVVAENGAAIWVPPDYFVGSRIEFGPVETRARIQTVYKGIKAGRAFDCEAFYELGVPGIVRETGLTEAEAARANDRLASEPIRWRDSEERLADFVRAAEGQNLRCVRGGRFLHLLGRTGKEEAVNRLLQAYSLASPEKELMSVSLGDGPNDLGMLATTDIAVIIPGHHGQPMPLCSNNRVLRPAATGPAGWNDAMLEILAEYSASSAASNQNGE